MSPAEVANEARSFLVFLGLTVTYILVWYTGYTMNSSSPVVNVFNVMGSVIGVILFFGTLFLLLNTILGASGL